MHVLRSGSICAFPRFVSLFFHSASRLRSQLPPFVFRCSIPMPLVQIDGCRTRFQAWRINGHRSAGAVSSLVRICVALRLMPRAHAQDSAQRQSSVRCQSTSAIYKHVLGAVFTTFQCYTDHLVRYNSFAAFVPVNHCVSYLPNAIFDQNVSKFPRSDEDGSGHEESLWSCLRLLGP